MILESAVGSARGKIILLGEHAVVHGIAAIAVPIDLSIEVEATRSASQTVLDVADWSYSVEPHDGTKGGQALSALYGALGVDPGHVLSGRASLRARAGLGASAALAAAVARSVLALERRELGERDLIRVVQASEKIFHGNPSGLDATLAVIGRPVVFSRQGGAQTLEAQNLPLVVAHSGQPGDTCLTVSCFAQRLGAEPREARRRLLAIGSLVDAGLVSLANGDLRALGQAMTENQEHLAWFGVSTPKLDRICRVARDAGALGAKLTGGGGGGVALALVEPGDCAVASALESAGFEVILR